ncbi:hypothetical protein JTE90_013583 [Oedothorax gibbosus]|uniref:Uncharacterized protein n=1 Tax=Oedothorax gibbosus TaxID=931172 RepID=A0AAV6VHA4_9ARAC|nr:hypothetical protein JTE90_013583 [Oedothorax gibbosus]
MLTEAELIRFVDYVLGVVPPEKAKCALGLLPNFSSRFRVGRFLDQSSQHPASPKSGPNIAHRSVSTTLGLATPGILGKGGICIYHPHPPS